MAKPNEPPKGGAEAPQAAPEQQAALDKKEAELKEQQAALDKKEAELKEQQAALDKKEAELKDAPMSKSESGQILAAEKAGFDQVRNDKKVKIVIASGHGAGERQPVFVAVNGMEYLIPRDSEWEIPRCVYQALCDATVTEYEFNSENTPVNPRQVPRYNIQVKA